MRFRPCRLGHVTPLAACLAAASGVALTPSLLLAASVQACGDGGPGSGSLRDVIATAPPGDVIDLSQLPSLCGRNSTITLSNGEIVVPQYSLTITGPDAGVGTVTISGNHAGRVFKHNGFGILTLSKLTVINGTERNLSGSAYGGCIYSSGSLTLLSSTVSGCSAEASGVAKGGGVYVYNALSMVESAISGNYADSTTMRTLGGGAYVYGTFSMKYSAVDRNTAHAPTGGAGHYSNGGGLRVRQNVAIVGSTISRNKSSQDGALQGDAAQITITNSTISENIGTNGVSGIWTSGSVTLNNSTVTSNKSYYNDSAALVVGGSTLTLQSSIVAGNIDANGPADLDGFNGVTVAGASSNNLVIASKLMLPADTLTTDPKLGPLQMNGGRTETHALLSGSPAITKGNNLANQSFDQRGSGYPRTTGASMLVDIGAFQFDSIFANGF